MPASGRAPERDAAWGISVTSLRVCSFESRRSEEMRSLLARQGVVATIVPSMRELPLESNPLVFAFAESLLAGRVDVVVFLTGVGAHVA